MIARYYDASKNENGGALPGVPLGDMSQEQYDELPAWLQASIDAHPMYRKTAPAKAKAEPKELDHASS